MLNVSISIATRLLLQNDIHQSPDEIFAANQENLRIAQRGYCLSLHSQPYYAIHVLTLIIYSCRLSLTTLLPVTWITPHFWQVLGLFPSLLNVSGFFILFYLHALWAWLWWTIIMVTPRRISSIKSQYEPQLTVNRLCKIPVTFEAKRGLF